MFCEQWTTRFIPKIKTRRKRKKFLAQNLVAGPFLLVSLSVLFAVATQIPLVHCKNSYFFFHFLRGNGSQFLKNIELLVLFLICRGLILVHNRWLKKQTSNHRERVPQMLQDVLQNNFSHYCIFLSFEIKILDQMTVGEEHAFFHHM